MCGVSVRAKNEPSNESIPEEASANQSRDTKEGGNGEANRNQKVVDVDVAKVEASAVDETEAATGEKLTTDVESEQKTNGDDISKIKEVGLPQPAGLYALTQAVPSPQEEEVFLIPEAIVGPVVLPQVFGNFSFVVAISLVICGGFKIFCNKYRE